MENINMQENLKDEVFDVLDIENINKKNKNEAIKYILNRENFLKKDIFDAEKFLSIFKTINIRNKEYKILSRDPQKKENSLKIIEKQMRNMGIPNDKILEMINHVGENTNPVYSEKVEKKIISLDDIRQFVTQNEFFLGEHSIKKQKPFFLPKSIKNITEVKNSEQRYLFDTKIGDAKSKLVLESGEEIYLGAQYIAVNYPELIKEINGLNIITKEFHEGANFNINSESGVSDFFEYIKTFEKANSVLNKILYESGVIENIKGKNVLDKKKMDSVYCQFKDEFYSQSFKGKSKLNDFFFEILSKIKVINKDKILDNPIEDIEEMPMISLPKNIHECLNGNFEKGIFNPWDLIKDDNKNRIRLDSFNISLKDDSVINVAELKVTKFLRDAFVTKDMNGILTYFDVNESKRKSLTSRKLNDLMFEEPLADEEKMNSISIKRLKEKLPNLFDYNIISIKNFDIISQGETYKNYGIRDKQFSEKGKNTFRFYTAGDGTFANYYFGRNKLVGTNIEINEQLRTAQLDDSTGAIISESFGKKVILFTFPIDSSKYMDNLRQEKLKEYGDKTDKIFTEKDLRKNGAMQVGANRMKEIMTSYSINDYLGESLKDVEPYIKNKILAVAGDYSFITNELREKLGPLDLKIATRPWKDQILLGSILAYTNDEKGMTSFLGNYTENGLNTLTSVLRGGFEMSQKILDIGEKLPAESANAIFTKYAELANTANKIELFIKKEFSDEIAENSKISEQVYNKILKKGVDILNLFHHRIDTFDKNETPNAVDIIKTELSKISADAIATLSTFKFARKNGFDLSLEDIQNSEFRKKSINDITEKEKQDMLNIYRENYKGNPELARALVSQFEKSFSREGSEFYIYSLNNKLNAFVRFEDFEDGKFASALNVAHESKGYSLGEAMMEQALSCEAENNILYAEANLDEWNTARYMELGFNAIEENKKYMVPSVNIIWDNRLNEKYISKNFSRDDILQKKNVDKSIIIEEYKKLSDFDRSRLGKLVMTRSIFNKENNKYYIVLEKNRKKNL